MRRFMAAVAFLALAVPVVLADEKDDAAKKLNGTYTVLDFIVRGKSDESKKDAKIAFTFKDGAIEIKEGDKMEDGAKFTLDPSKKPPHIDIMPDKGAKVVHGIYEVKDTDKGTELTIAFTKGGGDRPKDFKGTGEGEAVLKLFRKK
jgi:uncharacterized protein (TIGR03067 family)